MKYLHLIRIRQWIKNGFLFVPLFFSGTLLWQQEHFVELLLGALSFSLVASAIYILNDYRDIEADRIHPEKSKRPLASGAVQSKVALVIAILCFFSGFAIALAIKEKFAFVLGLYFLLNIAYSMGLKKIAILDIIIISVGFVLRIKAGGVIAGIAITQWLMVMVFLLALFLAIAKRRDDMLLKIQKGIDVRVASKSYNMEFLNALLVLISGIVIIAYLMYTLDQNVIIRLGTYRLYYTSVFVIAGVMRYLQLAFVENNTGSPTDLLYKDTVIQLSIIGWVISYSLILYFPEVTLFD